MKNSKLHYLIREPQACEGFRTCVSLHSHTMHSRESTAFVARIANKSKWFSVFIEHQLKKYSGMYAEKQLVNLEAQANRIWWTSPLSAAQAFQVEKQQIEELGLQSIVSLTDHDNIEAPLQLQMIADNACAPISVEWTTPYHETYFHIGVHNLHPDQAQEIMREMEELTTNPTVDRLRTILADLASKPDVLIILNHPHWDQAWLGAEKHERLLEQFLKDCGEWLHALEINGLRSWTENRKVVRLAKETGVKLISGGDRHGREPAATLNLTNATTFAEFAQEIRSDAPSQVLIMSHFHDPLLMRMLQSLWDILKDHPEHALGRVRWTERTFRHCYDDSVKSFDQFFEGREPFLMKQMANATRLATSPRMRRAWQHMAIPAEAAL